jgi:two-component system nitrate/nitrite sensor histidine kinase NarX
MNSRLLRHSLPLHAWGAIFTISILCFISALGGGMLAWVSETDAQAINTAGSIRMATYRISFQLATNFSEDNPFDLNIGLKKNDLEGKKEGTENVEGENRIGEQDKLSPIRKEKTEEISTLIEDMESRLAELRDYQLANANDNKAINNQLKQIESQWFRELKPALLSQDAQKFYIVSFKYIEDVDSFVNELQYRNEQRQTWQQILQIVSLVLTVIIMLVGMQRLRQNVLIPVQQLIKANYKFKQGKRNTRVSISGYTEFNALGDSFNDMASTIETHQRSLESEVQIKTQHLVKANQVLSLFYDFSKSLTTSQVSLYRLDTLITDFGKVLPHLEFTLCIQNKFINNKNAIILHGEKMKELCKKLNCDNCLTKEGVYTKSYPIAHQKVEFGELKVRPKSVLLINSTLSPNNNDGNAPSSQRIQIAKEGRTFFESEIGSELDLENNELIVALTNLISTALSLRKQRQQEHQLILFEERSTIARELHDSLAQSLSYLKIQVSVLERHLKKGSDEQNEASVRHHIDQIKTGLSSAYQQLRDLLITFRLTIDNDNFDEALHEAANEFALKGKFDITVSNRVMTLNLSATEQIDLIQIAREALSNISRHAQAESVDIELGYDDEDKYIVMTIVDDGVGISGTVDQTQHHGLMIMKERAHNLGGELIVSNNQPQGTTVTAKFAPNFFDENISKEAYL